MLKGETAQVYGKVAFIVLHVQICLHSFLNSIFPFVLKCNVHGV